MIGRSVKRLRQFLLDRMILRPSRSPIDHGGQQRAMLSSGDRPLECFVHRNHDEHDAPDVLILKFPGTAGRAERSSDFPIELLPPMRGTVWTWNPPGYGGSGGRASLQRIAHAAIDFWEQVTVNLPADTPVLLCGNSLGCATALSVAANVCKNRPRSGMLLRNPPPLVPVVKHVASRYPLSRLVDPIAESLCDPMNAILTAQQVDVPALFLQSELDTLVPPPLQQQVVDAYAGETKLAVLKGLSHGGIPDDSHEPLIQDSIDWLWKRVTTS